MECTESPRHWIAGLYSLQTGLLSSSLVGIASSLKPQDRNEEHEGQHVEPVNLARSKGQADDMSRFANVQDPFKTWSSERLHS